MAIAKFEFDISTPEGKDDFEVYRRGREMASAIYDFEQILRSKYKYGVDKDVTADGLANELWTQWHSIKREYSIEDL